MAETKVSILDINNPYRWRMVRNAGLTAASSVNTKIPYDAVEYDPSGGVTIGSSRYTAQVAGTYHVDARTSYVTSTAVGFIMIYVNGIEVRRGTLGRANTEYNGIAVSDSVQLAVGDYVEAWYFIAGALGMEVGGKHTYFSGFLINQNAVGS